MTNDHLHAAVPGGEQARASVRRLSTDHTARRSALALAVCAVLYPAAYAGAQGSLQLEEIIVTATKRSLDLQDVPQSIAAFSTADVERLSLLEMGDYIKFLPSISLAQSQPGRNTVIVRGIATGTSEFRTDSLVAVYLDEQPMTTANQQVSPYMVDIERVEALPGPQGTLFGSAAPGGALRIITNKPNFDGLSGQIYGNWFATDGGDDSYEMDGHVNVPLIDGKLALRVTGFYANHGGWVDNVLGPDLAGTTTNADVVEDNFNNWEAVGGRVAALWNVTDDLDLLFSFVGQSEATTGSWATDPYLGDNKITLFYDEYRDDDWWQAGLTITADLGFAELKAATSYLDREIAYEFDNMTYEQYKTANNGGPDADSLYNTEYTFGTQFNFQHQDRFSQEIRLVSTTESRLQWMAGLFYEDVYDEWEYGAKNPELMNTKAWEQALYWAAYYNNQGFDVASPLAPTDIGFQQTVERSVKQVAVFGEVTYSLTDAWSMTAGSRWFEYERDEYERNEFPGGLPPFGGFDTNGAVESKGKDSDVLFKFDTRYRFDDDRMAYFLFSQGFRLGGTNSQRAAATGQVPAQYKADSLDNFEIGLKSQWWDNRLTLNVSAYLMKWKDRQLEQGNVGVWWVRGNFNGEGAESKGIELSGAARIAEGLTLDFSASFGNSELTDDTVYPNGDVVPDGTPTPYAPDTKYWVGIEYTVGGWKPFGGDLWMRFDYTYQSEMFNSLWNARADDEGGVIPSWDFGTAKLGMTLPSDLEVTLTIDNIWNEAGMNWLSDDGRDAEIFGDPRFRETRSLFRPRNIGIGIRKKF